jgi:hypothetical protein
VFPGLHVKDDAAGVDEGETVVVAHGSYNVRDDEADMGSCIPLLLRRTRRPAGVVATVA